MPAAQEVAVITEVASSVESEIEVLVVSNEIASPALQALMEEQSATVIAADIAPKTAASQISNLVEKLKNKLISPAKISLEKTPEMSTVVVKENTNNTQDSQAETLQSTYWRWLIVGGAGLVLLLLLFILRRTSKQADKS
jgi:signal recognition particle GTPase